MTKAESKMWVEILRNKKFFGYTFLRQKPIGHFILDFYCAALHWVIEVDGDSHSDTETRDMERTQYLEEEFNLRVIRYSNEEVLNNISGVYENLLRRLENPS